MSRASLLTLTAFLAAFLVVGAGVSAAADVDPAKLVGKWENKMPSMTQTWTFAKDGKWTMAMKSEFLNRTESGTYTVKKNVLTTKTEKSTDKKREGKSTDATVMELTDEKLKIAEDPTDETTAATYKRVKEAK